MWARIGVNSGYPQSCYGGTLNSEGISVSGIQNVQVGDFRNCALYDAKMVWQNKQKCRQHAWLILSFGKSWGSLQDLEDMLPWIILIFNVVCLFLTYTRLTDSISPFLGDQHFPPLHTIYLQPQFSLMDPEGATLCLLCPGWKATSPYHVPVSFRSDFYDSLSMAQSPKLWMFQNSLSCSILTCNPMTALGYFPLLGCLTSTFSFMGDVDPCLWWGLGATLLTYNGISVSLQPTRALCRNQWVCKMERHTLGRSNWRVSVLWYFLCFLE